MNQLVLGMEKAQSDALLAHLYAQAAIPEYQCRFRWSPGAIAFWDNRAGGAEDGAGDDRGRPAAVGAGTCTSVRVPC